MYHPAGHKALSLMPRNVAMFQFLHEMARIFAVASSLITEGKIEQQVVANLIRMLLKSERRGEAYRDLSCERA